jgi:hypothetical protein
VESDEELTVLFSEDVRSSEQEDLKDIPADFINLKKQS